MITNGPANIANKSWPKTSGSRRGAIASCPCRPGRDWSSSGRDQSRIRAMSNERGSSPRRCVSHMRTDHRVVVRRKMTDRSYHRAYSSAHAGARLPTSSNSWGGQTKSTLASGYRTIGPSSRSSISRSGSCSWRNIYPGRTTSMASVMMPSTFHAASRVTIAGSLAV